MGDVPGEKNRVLPLNFLDTAPLAWENSRREYVTRREILVGVDWESAGRASMLTRGGKG